MAKSRRIISLDTKNNLMSDIAPAKNNISVSSLERQHSSSSSEVEDTTGTFSIEQRFEAARQDCKIKNWREGPYAAGLVELTWKDELNRFPKKSAFEGANGPNRRCCDDAFSREFEPTCGCNYFSGWLCGRIGVGRVGNMIILKESNVIVEEEVMGNPGDVENPENLQYGSDMAKLRVKKLSKQQIDLVIGPYWPMMLFITFPLIIGFSLWTAVTAIYVPGQNRILQVVWTFLTFMLCRSLFNVGFRDPGILPRYKEVPDNIPGRPSHWRWNDNSQSYVVSANVLFSFFKRYYPSESPITKRIFSILLIPSYFSTKFFIQALKRSL